MNVQKYFRYSLPLLSAAGGVVAYALRLAQIRIGFEAATGLPIPGSPATVRLVVFCAASCLVLAGLSILFLPGDRSPVFPFSTDSQLLLTPVVAGGLLLALAGGADIIEGMSSGSLLARIRGSSLVSAAILRSSGLGVQVQILSGILTLAAAFALLLSAAACRGNSGTGVSLLMVPVSLMVRLVVIYRMDSVNPILEDYAPDLIALALLSLGFYSLSSFAFQSGSLRWFAFYTCTAELFCLCSLANEGRYLSVPLIYLGASLALAGFLLLSFQAPAVERVSLAPEQSGSPAAEQG